MLHIVTPLYLVQYLEQIWFSINADSDITWHISKTKINKLPELGFLTTDKRIKIYEIDCEERETDKKRNIIFENIKDGYFCLLDDDTVFHENMYIKYLEAKNQNFVGMLIGEQLMPDGINIRLRASPPQHLKIDSGNVLCHHGVLSSIRWRDTHIEGINNKDSIFWGEVYDFYGKKCFLTNEPISIYNKLSQKLNVLHESNIIRDKNGKLKKVYKRSKF